MPHGNFSKTKSIIKRFNLDGFVKVNEKGELVRFGYDIFNECKPFGIMVKPYNFVTYSEYEQKFDFGFNSNFYNFFKNIEKEFFKQEKETCSHFVSFDTLYERATKKAWRKIYAIFSRVFNTYAKEKGINPNLLNAIPSFFMSDYEIIDYVDIKNDWLLNKNIRPLLERGDYSMATGILALKLIEEKILIKGPREFEKNLIENVSEDYMKEKLPYLVRFCMDKTPKEVIEVFDSILKNSMAVLTMSENLLIFMNHLLSLNDSSISLKKLKNNNPYEIWRRFFHDSLNLLFKTIIISGSTWKGFSAYSNIEFFASRYMYPYETVGNEEVFNPDISLKQYQFQEYLIDKLSFEKNASLKHILNRVSFLSGGIPTSSNFVFFDNFDFEMKTFSTSIGLDKFFKQGDEKEKDKQINLRFLLLVSLFFHCKNEKAISNFFKVFTLVTRKELRDKKFLFINDRTDYGVDDVKEVAELVEKHYASFDINKMYKQKILCG